MNPVIECEATLLCLVEFAESMDDARSQMVAHAGALPAAISVTGQAAATWTEDHGSYLEVGFDVPVKVTVDEDTAFENVAEGSDDPYGDLPGAAERLAAAQLEQLTTPWQTTGQPTARF